MGTPLLPNAYRVLLLFTAPPGGRPWSTKFDYTTLPSDPLPTPQEVTDAFYDEWVATVASVGGALNLGFNGDTRLATIRTYRLDDPLEGYERPGPATPLGSGTTVQPGEVAIVASLRTAFLGRRYRGRQYWGGLSQGAIGTTTGLVTAGFQAALQDLVDGLAVISSITDVTLIQSVISGQGSDLPRPPGLATPINQIIVDQFPDTQRRRGGR